MPPALLLSTVSIAVGAACGALIRWVLGLWLTQGHQAVPLGTLAANILGGFGIGLAMGLFAQHPEWPAEWRLFVITGFLGGLTTFSTFSAEVMTHLLAGRWGWGSALVLIHVAASLAATGMGLAAARSVSPS